LIYDLDLAPEKPSQPLFFVAEGRKRDDQHLDGDDAKTEGIRVDGDDLKCRRKVVKDEEVGR